MKDYSYVFNAHPSFIDSMYKKWKEDPNAVEEGWRSFFMGFEFKGNGETVSNGTTAIGAAVSEKDLQVVLLIEAFRQRGHLLSTTNPIRERRDRKPKLDLADYKLSEADLNTKFAAGAMIGMPNASLNDILDKLKKIYAGNIGFEYAHIANQEKRKWLQDKIESANAENGFDLSIDKKTRILKKLNGAVVFEKFLHTKYIGQKRFSLEGGETTIAALDAIINKAGEDKVEEVVIGMAHRGRLNVLANIMGKTYEQIFNEFEGIALPEQSFGDGDVKYHLGFKSQVDFPNGKKMNLKLAPNPSHLESVNTVVEGFSRAKADLLFNGDYDKILPILIHGDAAIAGQGIAYETVQMSQLEGYYTGGTIHFVINNQVGFTTDFDDARSATYCTSVASLVQAPVFHVNGDDPEAVVFAVELATEYRQLFNNDVFIDMVCYRKHGHNEGDDPKFTQPEMYSYISKHKDPRELYSNKLTARGDVEKEMAANLEKEFWADLQARQDRVKQKALPYEFQPPEQEWQNMRNTTDHEDFTSSPSTGIDGKRVKLILDHLRTPPEGFTPLSKVARLYKGMNKILDQGKLDWALGELLAYGSILLEGKNVRMSGQDVKRGTFSHRHAILNDSVNYQELNRLDGIAKDQGKFMIYNSLLSEFGVLGFEYGYSMAAANSLVIWEAQFGDFYNGAQTIIDQYVTAAESKWLTMSGLVMLLPHGYEGQGPEHSSARLERFLNACAECNITVTNLTTPANLFHIMRRQLARDFRKPLINMSPKSLLRHPLALSDVKEFEGDTKFMEVIDEIDKLDKKVKRVILCTGKVYYDLLTYRRAQKINDIAIVRVEQLYPTPRKQLEAVLENYKGAEIYWVQEEPENMGAARFMQIKFAHLNLKLVARKSSASPATGYKKMHDQNQARLIADSFK